MCCPRSHNEMAGMKLESSRLRLGSFPRGTADEQCANGSATFTCQDNAEVAPRPTFPASAAFKIDSPILVWFVL